MSFSAVVSFKSPRQLEVVTVVGCKEVRADEEKYKASSVEVFINCPLPVFTGTYAAVVPRCDNFLSLELCKVF
jgi:hypothetical protein